VTINTQLKIAYAVAVVAAVFWLVTGVWAFFAPASFDAHVAQFAPYNRHLTHDVGAFSIGIGSFLVFGLWRNAGLFVALAGASVAAVLHAMSHFLDKDIGGRSTDPYLLTVFAVITLIGAVAAFRAQSSVAPH
jgi:hypothetical protein